MRVGVTTYCAPAACDRPACVLRRAEGAAGTMDEAGSKGRMAAGGVVDVAVLAAS